jgi:hypothetical protein
MQVIPVQVMVLLTEHLVALVVWAIALHGMYKSESHFQSRE